MKKSIKMISLCLCLVFLVSVFTACGTKTVMSYEDKTLSVNVYEFLMSRMKGTLAYYGYEVDKDSFWNTVIDMNGTTYDDYFCQVMKEQAMNYIIADKIFDERGLVFGESDEAQIDKVMKTHVDRAGSKSSLNAELKEFGVNYDILREIYVLEAKIELLREHLYGKDGEKIDSAEKEKFFNENYVAFRQIFLATYDYVTDEDRFGDIVYYTDEKHEKIAYDTVGGVTKTDEFGKTVKDILGDTEYYTADGRIAYDRQNGVIGYVTNDDGDKVIEELDDKEKAALHEKAQEYLEKCNGDVELFEDYIKQYDESENDGVVYLVSSAGYYAAQNDAVAYFDEMAEKLAVLDPYECVLYQSEYGYHVLCRYENEPGAYDKEENKDIFETFTDDLISTLFEDMCRKLYDSVTVDSAVFGDAPTMKEVGINTKY
ncbi:MAG: hypothetical protein ACI3X1_03060 [Eubacteriales bacterium]